MLRPRTLLQILLLIMAVGVLSSCSLSQQPQSGNVSHALLPDDGDVAAASAHCDTTLSPGDAIQTAIDGASSGTTICLGTGTYADQHLAIATDGVSLVGLDPTNRPVLDGGDKSGVSISLEGADGVQLRNLVLARYRDGVSLDHTAGVIQDLLVKNVASSDNHRYGFGALSDASGGPEHSGLTFLKVTASDNDGSFLGRGAFFIASVDNVTVRDSQFRNNGLVGLDFGTSADPDHENIAIEHVSTSGNGGVGIALHDAIDSTLKDSTVADGLDINGVVNTEITHNTFSGSPGFGMRIRSKYGAGPNRDITLTLNNITENQGYGVINTVPDSFTLHAECNYWGHATGPEHTTNRQGQGEDVTDGVDFSPWSPRSIGTGAHPEASCQERGRP